MNENIVPVNIQSLVDGWMQEEREGVKFPVPFETAWTIAGYSRKDSAKRALKPLQKEIDYSTRMWKTASSGRSSESISLSCDAFKHLCLMANTEEGRQIREYFIDAEKKWKLVQSIAPQVASDVEILHLQIELARIEAQKEQAIAQGKQADLQILQFRNYVAATGLPEAVQQKILGYTEVKSIEYRDRVLLQGDVIRDGTTINKTEMCRRLDFKTRSGSPDYKKLNEFLLRAKLPESAWREVSSIQPNKELSIDWWERLQRGWLEGDRNLYLGESELP